MTLHADHIGSLLRPPELLEARAAHDRGDLSDDALERAEDDAIVAALEVQRAAGLQIFSDGEYRRSWFAGGLPSVIDGLIDNDEAISLQWEGAGSSAATKVTTEVKLGTSRAARRLSTTGRVAEKEVAFLREHSPGPFKATMTGALHFVRDWYRPGATDAYPDTTSMIDHIVEIMADEVAQLSQEGVSYMQLDSLLYVIPAPAAMLSDEGLSREAILDAMIDADNAVLAPARAAGITTTARHGARRRLRPAAVRARLHDRRPGPDLVEVPRAGVARRAPRAHRGGDRVRADRAARAQPAVRLRLDGPRQPHHLGRPAAQARARGVGRRRGLGIVTATSGILGR
jgi:5-methyltetrahydropteroyltriglutamate--homocysteine methyltransferase